MTNHHRPFSTQASAFVAQRPDALFARLDDPTLLGAHMRKPSLMMGGGSMAYELDAVGGRAVGSVIGMRGGAFGLRFSADEVVTERAPPVRKVWETIGTPRLIVVSHYRMGFTITPEADGSRLTVFIEYGLPSWGPEWVLRPLGQMFARWCVESMAKDAAHHFSDKASEEAA